MEIEERVRESLRQRAAVTAEPKAAWTSVQDRLRNPPNKPRSSKLVAAIVAVALAAAGLTVAVRAFGRGPRPLTPSTSPRIAFLQYVRTPGGGNANLVTMNPDGSDKRVIAQHVDPDIAEPSWSADGEWVAFYGNQDRLGLWVARADGFGARRLLSCARPRCSADDFALSPNGSRLALVRSFVSSNGTPASSLEIVEVATGRTRVVCRYPVCGPGLAQPTWSPDGTLLAFSQANKAWAPEFGSPPSAIFVVGADGSDLRQLTDVGCTPAVPCSADINPAWSPDGKAIAFFGPQEIVWVPRSFEFLFASNTLLFELPLHGTAREVAAGVAGGIAWLPAP